MQISLTSVQRRLWFLGQLGTNGRDDVVSLACKVPDGIDEGLLQQRLDAMVENHSALRIRIRIDGEDVIQQIVSKSEAHGLYIHNRVDTKHGGLSEQMTYAKKSILESSPKSFFRADLLHTLDSSDVLLLTAHRLVCDVDSLEYIASCLLNPSYNIVQSGVDFANFVGEMGSDYRADLSEWVEYLRDATFICELPFDKARPAQQQDETASYRARLSSDTLSRIKGLAEDNDVPQSVVLMAAYLSLIYRYTLQEDILVGLAHRPDGPLVGPFTDTAIVRQQFADGITFSQILTSLRQTYAGLLSRPRPAFPLLLDALSPMRDLSRAPIVQHGFVFKDFASGPTGDLGQFEPLYASVDLHQLDLMLRIRFESSGLAAEWSYDTALFSEETIYRMHTHFEALIASAAENVKKPVKQLLLMTPEEKELITIKWNNTTRAVADHDFIYRLFEKQVARTPQAIAAHEPGSEITYEALNRQANRMAHLLVDQGVGADTIVSILADRNIEYLTTILAINKAGGAFLPLSPTYPARRLAAIFEKSDCPLVLVGENYLEIVEEAVQYMPPDKRPGIKIISTALAEGNSETNLAARCEMQHLAYVMFTSGSTGEPKGVMVHHAGNINHIYAKIIDLDMGASDTLAQTSRQSFDIVVWQFLAPLVVGGSVYIMPDEIALDPAQLLKASEQYRITILQLVPVNIEALLDVADAMADHRPLLAALRWMVPTGDALPTDLCRRWLKLYPHAQMLNTYGATECSDDQCHHVIGLPPSLEYRPAVMTIGTPIINTQVYILDDAMQPVPVGVIGELYIAGVGVGRGYLKDAERTARTFVPNPYSDDPGSKLYRSGDQSRYLPDGTIEFIGRIGHMIKIRGMRIEPGEIQAVLGRHPQVAQATLIVHEFAGVGTHLIAYVVYRKNEPVGETDLRAYLRQYLPDYMIPSYFVTIDSMPLNANGKIDRKALPIPDLSSIKVATVAPRTDTESTLMDIWSGILNRNELSIHDNFFDVGGHSLLAMQLFSQIERQFGQRLPLKTIFNASTIANQAELLTSGSSTKAMDKYSGLSCIVPIQLGDPQRPPFFCVHAAGGHVIFFHGLARYLGTDQSFYGIQALGIDGNHKPLNRFEQLAAVYIKEMRVVQPEGPYYIGGECMGGTIAFEVARQLEEQGQVVGLLVMFDTFCAGIVTLKPGMPMWLYEVLFNIRRFRVAYFSKLRNESLREMLSDIIDIIRRTLLTIRRIFLGRILSGKKASDPLSLTQAALDEAEHAYKPGVIRAPITLFNSNLPRGLNGDETLGWYGHSSNGVEIHRIATLFDMMIEGPNAKLAADHLREILDKKFAEQANRRTPV
ncbi:MAG: amino acid adenylation domain-containing protein [Candidatus Doudnabacteria bacterium]|nr:amino acid adenylation domain-containing protein [Candidatus Doudnabacteria bacterium]